MVRRLAFIPVCLTLGVATSVAIAWAIAYRLPQFEGAGTIGWSPADGAGWYFRRWDAPGAVRLEGVAAVEWMMRGRRESDDATLPAWSEMHAPIDSNTPPVIFEEAFGWPAPALTHAFHEDHGRRGRRPALALINGIELEINPRNASANPRLHVRLLAGEPYALPLRPAWGGLVADSLLFAVGWLLVLPLLLPVLRSPWAVRRWVRRRRGRCPACGYDLRGSVRSQCPECGVGAGHRGEVGRGRHVSRSRTR